MPLSPKSYKKTQIIDRNVTVRLYECGTVSSLLSLSRAALIRQNARETFGLMSPTSLIYRCTTAISRLSTRTHILPLSILLGALLFGAAPTATATSDDGNDRAALIALYNATGGPNMDFNLNQQFQTGQFTAQAAANAPIHREESVAVTVYVTEGYAQDVWDWLEETGSDPRSIGIDYIEAHVPAPLLPQASAQEGVITIRTTVPAQTTQGAVVSEGVAVHGVPTWHDAGFTGRGVKIGIIDYGFEGFQSLMETELPASVQARCYTDIDVFTSNLADCDNTEYGGHGTAVTEVVFDIAPDATYYIAHSSTHQMGNLRSIVDWMVAQGVDVINTSSSYPQFGPDDGAFVLSDATFNSVDIAVAGGIVWVTSAGNAGDRTGIWVGEFSDKDFDGLMEFNGSDETNQFHSSSRGRGDSIYVSLVWDDTWFNATRDLDLCLLTDEGEIVECSERPQTGDANQYPVESIVHEVTREGDYYVEVRHSGGSAPAWVSLFSRLDLEHNSGGHYTLANPAVSRNPGLLAVGAAPWSDPHTISSSSSRGPTRDGRTKPDITGATGVSSSVYVHGFGGTSASSPNVAGLAALVKQRFPHYSPQQIAQYLKDNAEPRPTNDPILGPSAHPNNTWGYGFARLPPIHSVETDRLALTALYNATGGANWSNNTNWLSDEPLGNWHGVTTDADGRVATLDLTENRLSGRMPSQLRDLSSLGELRLRNNDLSGPIPPELGSLSRLEWLDLALNRLTGSIPSGLRHLSNLKRLSLSGNQLSGCISDVLRDVPNNDLENLGLAFCSEAPCVSRGAVSDASNHGLVSDCEVLLSSRDALAGSATLNWAADVAIEQWDGITISGRVTWLDLSANKLTGEIPAELGSLPNLNYIDLSANELTGEIPAELGSLGSLRYMELGANKLSGEIPAELGRLSNLRILRLYQNQFTGEIPSELGRLSNLKELRLHINQLTGEIPPELGNLSNLQSLSLSRNQLTGCIPPALRDVPNNDLDRLSLRFCSVSSPGAPTVDAVTPGTGSLAVSWTAPSDHGGSVITAYDLRHIETSDDETVDSNWTVVDDVWTTGGGSLQYTLTGLTGGTQYDLQIRAVNAVGDGPWSGIATGTPTTAGDRIAFQSNRDGNWEIYVMNADGSGRHKPHQQLRSRCRPPRGRPTASVSRSDPTATGTGRYT